MTPQCPKCDTPMVKDGDWSVCPQCELELPNWAIMHPERQPLVPIHQPQDWQID